MRTTALAVIFSAVAAEVNVPGGLVVPDECIFQAKNGELVDLGRAESSCHTAIPQPNLQIYASDVHLHSSEPLKSFTADWVVPPLPQRNGGQVVYFWPGFKSQQPEMGLPVLQPVLQYGQHTTIFGKGQWELQSWFVDGNDPRFPVVTAPAIKVSPGDHITSFMSLSDDGSTWTVSGTDLTTGEDSTLNIAYAKAGATDYDYAMLVNENINVNANCGLMPDDSAQPGVLTFTNVTVNGKVPEWTTRANCDGNPQCDCGNAAEVVESGDVNLKWSTQPSALV
jgi:hypothetical protein